MKLPQPEPSTFDALASELRRRLSSDVSRVEDVVQIARRLPGFEQHLRRELEGDKGQPGAAQVPLDRIVMRFGLTVLSHQLDFFLGQGRRAGR